MSDLSVDAAGRHGTTALRPGARRRRRHYLDIAWLQRRTVSVDGSVRAAVHDQRRAVGLARSLAVLREAWSVRIPRCASACGARARCRLPAHPRAAGTHARGFPRHEVARADASDQQVARGSRRRAGVDAGHGPSRRDEQGRDRRRAGALGSGAGGQGAGGGALSHGNRSKHAGALHGGIPVRHESQDLCELAAGPQGRHRPELRGGAVGASRPTLGRAEGAGTQAGAR